MYLRIMLHSPTISFLVPDISSPTIGAALRLATALKPHYSTQIVGSDFGRGICSMYRGRYPFTRVPAGRIYRYPDYWRERRRLAAAVKGDIVVAVKAFANTVPVAVLLKRSRGAKTFVYLDEWDGALWEQLSFKAKFDCLRRHWYHPLEACHHGWVEKSIAQLDGVISTTTFLQHRFGGSIVHAGVDTERFKPQPETMRRAMREKLGLRDKRVIVFGGVVRPHKGVEEILAALVVLGDDRNRLLVVGPLTEHLARIRSTPEGRRYIVVAGEPLDDPKGINAKVHQQMPLYLDAGDAVVLPLRDTSLARSQMPIKVFEAMAMAKPLIATAVADLPLMLNGCGKIVPPSKIEALASGIQELFADPEAAQRMGAAAREKCIREYSREVTEKKVVEVVERIWKRGEG